MAPTSRQTARSVLPRKGRGFFAPLAVALMAAASLAACNGDSGKSGQPAPSASSTTDATPSDATPSAATPSDGAPLVSAELIAFEHVVSEETRDLYAVGPDGGEPRLLNSSANLPQWSPDGRQLAFLACLDPPDCTTATALLDRSAGEIRGLPRPDPDLFTACWLWAPSGRQLACEGLSDDDPTRNGIYSIRSSDGRGLTRITRNPGGDDIPLAWSPDGQRLVFAREDPTHKGSDNQALFVAPVSGGRPHRITPWGFTDDLAGWSADGRTIVFGTDGALYRVRPDGQGLAEITLQMPDGSSPVTFDVAFSPDGHRIVFSVSGLEQGIYTARLDGSDVQRLTNGNDHHANWGVAPSR